MKNREKRTYQRISFGVLELNEIERIILSFDGFLVSNEEFKKN